MGAYASSSEEDRHEESLEEEEAFQDLLLLQGTGEEDLLVLCVQMGCWQQEFARPSCRGARFYCLS